MWSHTGIQSRGIDEGSSVKFSDSPSVDAFFRARFSQPFTLFDSKQIWDDPDIPDTQENFPLYWDNQETSGSGTSTTFNLDRASTTLGVSAATAGARVRQTKMRFNYQPGKSQAVYFTCLINPTGDGITKQIGLFDENNGTFFQLTGDVLSVVIRSSVSGSPVDTIISSSEWTDSLRGTGPSGQSIDLGTVQLLFFDFQWLGVGRLRWGIFIGGVPFYFESILNANTMSSVYMSTPNLPFRSEIINDGSGGADTLECMCVTIISEGGVQSNGVIRFDDIGTATHISAGMIGVTYAICGIRLKPSYLSADVRETFVSIIENSGANNPFVWRLHFNPTLGTGLTYTDVPNSPIEFGIGLAAGDPITSPGTVFAGGYQSRQDTEENITLESAVRLGSLIDGTRDEIILSGSPLTNNQRYFGGIQRREAW